MVGALGAAALSLGLLFCGIGMIRRRRWVVSSIRIWAIVKAVLYGGCLGCLTVALVAMPSERLGRDMAIDVGGLGAAVIIIVMLLLIAWFLFWPIFILIWFSRDRIKAEVANWT